MVSNVPLTKPNDLTMILLNELIPPATDALASIMTLGKVLTRHVQTNIEKQNDPCLVISYGFQ